MPAPASSPSTKPPRRQPPPLPRTPACPRRRTRQCLLTPVPLPRRTTSSRGRPAPLPATRPAPLPHPCSFLLPLFLFSRRSLSLIFSLSLSLHAQVPDAMNTSAALLLSSSSSLLLLLSTLLPIPSNLLLSPSFSTRREHPWRPEAPLLLPRHREWVDPAIPTPCARYDLLRS